MRVFPMVAEQSMRTFIRILLLLAWAAMFVLTATARMARADQTEAALARLCGSKSLYLAPMVRESSRRFLVPPSLSVAVMATESRCSMTAVGKAGERCAFQVHGVARNGRSKAELSNPRTCVDTGIRWLSLMITWCGSVPSGLGAYNRGKCGVTRYARAVLAAWKGER